MTDPADPALASPAGPKERTARGRAAEQLVERRLAAQGWSILGRNVRRAGGEIDLVARDGQEIVFIEVRARRARSRFDPAATISRAKWRRLLRAADSWLGEQGLGNAACRFDLVALEVDRRGWRVRHIRGAFVEQET